MAKAQLFSQLRFYGQRVLEDDLEKDQIDFLHAREMEFIADDKPASRR